MEKRIRSAEKLADIGKLAANIAHEIRNPLASISGCVEMLKESMDKKDSEKGRLLPIITREMDRLNRLLSDFLGYARPQDTFSDKKKPISMRSLLKETLLLLPIHGKNQKKKLTVEWKDEIKGQLIFVNGHEDSLKQALLNIFINAYEAVNNPHPKIVLTIRREEAFFCLKIKDNGPGIPLEIQEKIFDPFYSTKTKGSGLGLSITYQMIQYHEGNLTLNSQNHEGAEFILKLPATFKNEKEHQNNKKKDKNEDKNFSG